MTYRFTTERPDYSDLSSGRVLHGLPGTPALPVRLASEVFQRCAARLKAAGHTPPYSLFDPCCGAGYHLGVLGILHRPDLREINAADIDEKAVGVTRQNLDLLDMEGMEQRMAEIAGMIARFGKDSHRQALQSALALRDRLSISATQPPLRIRVFQANALDASTLLEHLEGASIDIVFTDIPYGWHSEWRGAAAGDGAGDPLSAMLAALAGWLHSASVVAIVSDKGQKAAHPAYLRLEQFQVGRRRIELLSLKKSRI